MTRNCPPAYVKSVGKITIELSELAHVHLLHDAEAGAIRAFRFRHLSASAKSDAKSRIATAKAIRAAYYLQPMPKVRADIARRRMKEAA